MKAVRVHELGAAEVLRYEEVADPKPEAGEALVKIEAAGTIVDVGREVSGIKVGDRVAYGISNGYGSYAELSAVPSWHLFKLPNSISCQTAAAVMLQGMTAHYLTHSTYAVKSNDTVLVHAAAGGTGLLLVQMAKMLGARVIGTVSTEAKAQLARNAGADAAINYAEKDFAAEVSKLTGGKGVNVVYDSVGKDTFEKSLDSLAPLAALVIFGQASGPVPPFDTAVLNAKGSLSLSRPSLTHNVANRSDVQWRAGDLFKWIEAGKLKVKIDQTYPLADAANAQRELESRRSVGKILLIPE